MITTRPTFEFFPSLVQWAFAALVGQWLGDGLWLVFLPGALHVLLYLGKPLFYCPSGNLGTRRKPELGEDMADVGLHSTHTHHQFFSNGAIGFALGHQSCHLAFTCGQPANLQEIPVEEAAQRLGLTAKALHVRLHRARRLLWKVFNHELRDHAQAFGLLLDQESIEGWRETRIWCLYCGQQRMQGWLELSTAGHVDLHLRCARCQREWIRTGARPELSGLKAFRPIFNRAQQFAVEHWTSMLKTRRCSFCHAPTMVRFIAPGEALPLYPAYLPYPGVRIFSHCHTCGFEGTINIGACLRFHPAVQAFIAQQPRWIYLPERGEEYNGQPAFRVELATLASKKRLLAWLDAQSLQVLHVVTE